MPIICLLNQKGGVGKTSTCHHLAGTLGQAGRRVLLVDNDPQASLTRGFFGPVATVQIDPGETIDAVLRGMEPFPAMVIKPTGVPGVDLIPGSKKATLLNVPAPHEADPVHQYALREFLAEVKSGYDMVIIDCPPNLHLCSWASLIASDNIIVPVQPEDYGAQGIVDVQESIDLVQSGPNPGLRPLGYLITMMGLRKSIHILYEETLRNRYGSAVFETRVADSVDYVEALNLRKTVAQYKPRGAAAKTMKVLVAEIERRLSGDWTATSPGADTTGPGSPVEDASAREEAA